MSCINVDIRPVHSATEVTIIADDSATKADFLLKKFGCPALIDTRSHYCEKKVDLATKIGSMWVTPPKLGEISLGLVCSIDIGYLILCSSDGDLITIDGKYLVIKRHAKISP